MSIGRTRCTFQTDARAHRAAERGRKESHREDDLWPFEVTGTPALVAPGPAFAAVAPKKEGHLFRMLHDGGSEPDPRTP